MHRSFICTLVLLAAASFGINPSGFAQQSMVTSVAGGQGGRPFSDTDIPSGARVLEVHVFAADWIDAVEMVYASQDGRVLTGPRRGGLGGQSYVFRLDSDEYIVGLSGRYGEYIDSLRIHTNKRTSPLFGGSGGSRDYRIDVAPGNQAVGFTGRAGQYLDAIGLIFAPITMRQVRQTTTAGGRGGSAFSDRDIPLGARISAVRVSSGNNIDAIQAVYTLRNGSVLEGPVHGGGGGRSTIFRLDQDEYIIGITGRYGIYIDSLSIRTNKRTSQVFGGRGGDRDFKIDVPAGCLGTGFAGRSAEYLDAVGLTYAPIDTSRQDQRRRPNRFRIQR